MNTQFEDIVNVNEIGAKNSTELNHLFSLAVKEKTTKAINDQEKVLLLAIDVQNDFMEKGELGVPGSHQDVKNITEFMYRNFNKISQVMVSLDTHQPKQIFHPCWWVDGDGNHPIPFTIITHEDVLNGKFKPLYYEKESVDYLKSLDETGKKKLCIWTYHCIEGTFGASLEGQFANMVYFHSIARDTEVLKVAKGQHPVSEMYGIVHPELKTEETTNYELLNKLKEFDKIVVVGEAKSHCVVETLVQIAEHYKDDRSFTNRIYVLEDCMSIIPSFEETTLEAYKNLEKEYGIHLVRSTEFQL